MSQIEEIASKHLGRTSDGGTMTRYETPDEADADLLVGIPRKLNREAYGIDDEKLPFGGYDTWNCYETSFMLENGYPVHLFPGIKGHDHMVSVFPIRC